MKIKLDENMPHALADLLRAAKHDVETVHEENLSGEEDSIILKKATEENRILITFDLDFGDIRSFPLGTHAGIVVFRIQDQRWSVLKKPAERLIASGRLQHLSHGLAIVDEKRMRMRFKDK